MKKLLYGLVIGAVLAFTGAAVADYTIKDGGGSTQTVLAFVCATTKICPAHVLIKSDGTEIGTTSNPVQVGAYSWAGGTLGAMANYGTSPGAVLVPGVNAYITGSAAGATAGTTSTNALGQMVNCAATTSPSGQSTGNQSLVNCTTNGQVRVTPSYGTTDAVGDPCQTATKVYKTISITTATTTNIITGAASKKTYICHMFLTSAAADNVAIISGTTGASCGSNTAGLIGGTTAANGPNFAANGGFSIGTGSHAVVQVQTSNDDVCIITSAATPLAGSVVYVQQ